MSKLASWELGAWWLSNSYVAAVGSRSVRLLQVTPRHQHALLPDSCC